MNFKSFCKSDGQGILDRYSIPRLTSRFITQLDDNRSFLVFKSMDDFMLYRKSVKEEMFHEVILKDNPRKFFLDIDYKADIGTIDGYVAKSKWFNNHVENIKKMLVLEFNIKYSPNIITTADLLEVVSHANIDNHISNGLAQSEKYKFSMNIIIDRYMFPNYHEFAFFGRSFIKSYDVARGSVCSVVDPQFYSDSDRKYIQNRMVFSTKANQSRYKYPLIDGKVVTDQSLYMNYVLQYDHSLSGSKAPILKQTYFRTSVVNNSLINIDDKLVSHILENTRSEWAGFKVRSFKDGCIEFDKEDGRGVYCPQCEEEHHNDNFLIFTIDPSGNVYRKCRQNNSRSIHIYTLPSATEEVKPVQYVPREIQDVSLYWLKPLAAIGANINIVTEQTISGEAFTDDRLILIKAEMKMGKSKALIKFLDTDERRSAKIIFISFRRTFSAEAKSKYAALGFKSYSDSDVPNSIDLNQFNKIIIQVESLHRIKFPIGELDYLIMDEVESIWSQFNSTNFRDFYGSFNVFESALRMAKHTIAMDANLGIRTARIFARQFAGSSINIYINKFNPNYQYKYYILEKDKWLTHLKTVIGQSSNVAIFTNSLKEAKTLKAFLTSTTSLKRNEIKMYNSKTKESVKSLHFSNVNSYWSKYRVIICTPTVSAGVSFEADHFHYVFGYFSSKSCNVETCRQMLGRVRSVIDKEIYLSINGENNKYLTDIRLIRKSLMTNRQELVDDSTALGYIDYKIDISTGDSIYDDTLVLSIILENIAFDNRSRNNFRGRMINQLSGKCNGLHYGCEIIEGLNIESSLVYKTMGAYRNIREGVKDKAITEIADAEVIDDEKYHEIIEKSRNLCDITSTEHNSMEKYKIVRTLGINPCNLSKETTGQFKKNGALDKFSHNVGLFYSDDWNGSIDRAHVRDKYLYTDTKHQSRDTIVFDAPIHKRIKTICDMVKLDPSVIVTTGQHSYDRDFSANTEIINRLMVELLPMIDVPYDDKFYDGNNHESITGSEYQIKFMKILSKYYGFRRLANGSSIKLYGIKNVIYVFPDESCYMNSKPYTGPYDKPTINVNWSR